MREREREKKIEREGRERERERKRDRQTDRHTGRERPTGNAVPKFRSSQPTPWQPPLHRFIISKAISPAAYSLIGLSLACLLPGQGRIVPILGIAIVGRRYSNAAFVPRYLSCRHHKHHAKIKDERYGARE